MYKVSEMSKEGIIVHVIDDDQRILDAFDGYDNIKTYTWEEFVG